MQEVLSGTVFAMDQHLTSECSIRGSISIVDAHITLEHMYVEQEDDVRCVRKGVVGNLE